MAWHKGSANAVFITFFNHIILTAVAKVTQICHIFVALSVFFYAKIKLEREVMRMFSDEVREKILSKKELQKLDLVTLSLVIHAIEEVLEEVDNEQSLSGTYDE